MDYSNEVLKIVEGALKSDKEKIINYTKLLINKLEENGEKRLSNSFAKVLANNISNISQQSLGNMMKIPLDQESRLPMADIIHPNNLEKTEVVLNRSAKLQISKFIDYYHHTDKLINAGINVPNSILLYGMPGCGKSELAKYISKELQLPLIVARIDGLISSYLGSTAKNIRMIFEYAEKMPCILFLDEFDAIAKVRDDNNELGELKRVVNALLQNIDNIKNKCIIIAATNHEKLLDPAIWRRFEFKIFIDKPEFEARKSLINFFINGVIKEKDTNVLATAFRGLTGAEIKEICEKSRIDALISDSDLSIKIIFDNYFDFINLDNVVDNTISEKDINVQKAKYLRNIDEKVFSYQKIADILYVSKSYVSNIFNQVEV